MTKPKKTSSGDVAVFGAYARDRKEFDYWVKDCNDPEVKAHLDEWGVLGYDIVRMTIKDMELACWMPDMRRRPQ